jgi:glutamine cyclotransferase
VSNVACRVVRSYPHDTTAFTQGLVLDHGALYESTGIRGRSSVRRVELETGRVIQRRDLDSDSFGEGITIWRSVLIQLTWRSGVAIVYDGDSLRPIHRFNYHGEGWGLTHDGHHLIMSNGTDCLTFRNPDTFDEMHTIRVTDGGRSIDKLNDLQYVGDTILANVWQTTLIAGICPRSGRVVRWMDLARLARACHSDGKTNVLNGIAYDAAGARLFVTGKLWPRLFELSPAE